MVKVCTMCHKEKFRRDFLDNISCADGFTPKCRECSAIMQKIYKERAKLNKKKEPWFVYHTRAPHPEEIVPDKNNLSIQRESFKHIFK